MVELAALALQPQTFDPVRSTLAGSSLLGNQIQQAAGMQQYALASLQLADAQRQHQALADFQSHGGFGNPQALQSLIGQPQLFGNALQGYGNYQTWQNTGNAQAAMRVLASGAEGSESRAQAWTQELARALAEHRIDQSTHALYSQQQPTDFNLQRIIDTARPLSAEPTLRETLGMALSGPGGQQPPPGGPQAPPPPTGGPRSLDPLLSTLSLGLRDRTGQFGAISPQDMVGSMPTLTPPGGPQVRGFLQRAEDQPPVTLASGSGPKGTLGNPLSAREMEDLPESQRRGLYFQGRPGGAVYFYGPNGIVNADLPQGGGTPLGSAPEEWQRIGRDLLNAGQIPSQTAPPPSPTPPPQTPPSVTAPAPTPVTPPAPTLTAPPGMGLALSGGGNLYQPSISTVSAPPPTTLGAGQTQGPPSTQTQPPPTPRQETIGQALTRILGRPGVTDEQRAQFWLNIADHRTRGEAMKVLQDIDNKTERTATETARGTALGTAQAGLPQALESGQTMLDTIDRVIRDPDLGWVTGIQANWSDRHWADPMRYVENTIPFLTNLPNALWSPTVNTTRANIAQIQGQAFLQAYQSLRGAGQISENEGKKATEAFSTLANLAQDDAGYMRALYNARREVWNLMNLARVKAGQQAMPYQPLPGEAGAGMPQARPSIGQIRDGDNGRFRYMGGDPNNEASWEPVR
jgi:hypothetical protein